MNVLIIDDSRAMRKIIARIVSKLGFEIAEAADGLEGLAALEADPQKYDLVLVDWNMPNMNGLDFTKTVRARDEFQNHKLVMITTETEPARMVQALMAGIDEFVMKPFTQEILIDKLRLIGVQIPSDLDSQTVMPNPVAQSNA